MRNSIKRAVAATFFLMPSAVFAAEPVRQIGIFVQPYYEAAPTPGEKPRVAVGSQYNELLSSSRREDVLAARDRVVATSKLGHAHGHDGPRHPTL